MQETSICTIESQPNASSFNRIENQANRLET